MATLIESRPLQRLANLQPEQGVKAKHYLDDGLAKLKQEAAYSGLLAAACTYDTLESSLTSTEKDALGTKWQSKYKKSMKGPALQRLGLELATDVVTALQTTIHLFAYSNSFDTKHVVADLQPNSGVAVGRNRNPKPVWSTAFGEAALKQKLTAEAQGKADGDHAWASSANIVGPANMALAQWHAARQVYRQEPLGVFAFTVRYRLLTVGRNKTITPYHLETA